jgi:hypothetical protein
MARRRCIFCGGTPVTNEHLFPVWLRPLLAALKPLPSDAAHIVRLLGYRGKDGVPTDSWVMDVPDIKTKVVCATCNGGWMSTIEANAKPVLGPLILGRPSTLDTGSQACIAQWIALKAIIEQNARPEPPPAEWLAPYNKERRPPATWYMRVGKYVGHRRAVYMGGCSVQITGHHPLAPGPLNYPGFMFTVQLGSFVGQLVATSQAAAHPINRQYWTDIWPHPFLRTTAGAGGLTAAWPPPAGIDEPALEKCLGDVRQPV